MRPFRRERSTTARRGSWVAWGDLGTWLIALVIAVGLWLFVNTGERLSERTLRVRLEPENLPAGLVITNQVAEFAELRVSGPGVILSGLDPKRMRTPLDLSGVRPGVATYAINPKMFQLPRKVEVVRVTPAQVSFQVDRLSRRLLPVRVERQGEVPAGHVVESVEVSPDKVEVSGPAGKLEGLRAVATEPLELEDLGVDGGREILKLVRPTDDEIVQLTPAEVLVEVKVEPVVVERELKGVGVELRGGTEGWRVEPARIALVVRGPEIAMEELRLDPGSVYVDVAELSPVGAHRLRPEVDLPEGLQLVRRVPDEVVVHGPPAKRPAGGRKAESKRE